MKKKAILLAILTVSLLMITGGCGKKNNVTVAGVNDTVVVGSDIVVEGPVTVEIYYANTLLTGFVGEEMELEELSAAALTDRLSSHNIVSTDTRVNGFWADEDGVTYHLDLSRQFKEYIKLMSEEGEYYVMGSLANTFLSAYDGEQIYITVDGSILETKHNTYTESLGWYNTEGAEDSGATDIGEIEDPEASVGDEAGEEELSTEDAYIIRDETEQSEVVDVHFPQISGLSDNEIEAAWNTYLLQVALAYEADGLLSYELNYSVTTQTPEFLSIVYYGSVYYDGAAHPYNYARTFNFDLTTLSQVRLADYADVNALAEKLIAGEYEVVSQNSREDVQTYLERIIAGDSLDAVGNSIFDLAGYDFDPTTGTYIANGYSYLKDGNVVLVMEAEHVLGDYVELMFTTAETTGTEGTTEEATEETVE